MPDREKDRTGLALSIQQPWAWLVSNGFKPVENRTWSTNVRGWIGIHAGQKLDFDGYGWVLLEFPHIPLPKPDELQRGAIVGRARLVDCVTKSDSKWFFGPFGFVFDASEPIPFRACRGRLGFFRPEIDRGAA